MQCSWWDFHHRRITEAVLDCDFPYEWSISIQWTQNSGFRIWCEKLTILVTFSSLIWAPSKMLWMALVWDFFLLFSPRGCRVFSDLHNFKLRLHLLIHSFQNKLFELETCEKISSPRNYFNSYISWRAHLLASNDARELISKALRMLRIFRNNSCFKNVNNFWKSLEFSQNFGKFENVCRILPNVNSSQ